MAAQRGPTRICLENRNPTRGGFGNSTGKRPARRESKRSSLARPIHLAERNQRCAIRIAARTWSVTCCRSKSKCGDRRSKVRTPCHPHANPKRGHPERSEGSHLRAPDLTPTGKCDPPAIVRCLAPLEMTNC